MWTGVRSRTDDPASFICKALKPTLCCVCAIHEVCGRGEPTSSQAMLVSRVFRVATALFAVPRSVPGVRMCAPMHNRASDALAALRQQIERDPENPQVHFELAALHMATGNPEEAADAMRKSVELEPFNDMAKEAYASIADELFGDGKYAAAESCWRHLDEIGDGMDPAVGERLAAALQRTGRLREAADVLFQTVQSPLLETGEQSWLWNDLGALIESIAPIPGAGPEWPQETEGGQLAPLVRIGDSKEALSSIECYRRAIALDPDNGQAHKALADALVILGGPSAAHAEFQRAAELMPLDICCATHCMYDGTPAAPRPLAPLPLPSADERSAPGDGATTPVAAVGLEALTVHVPAVGGAGDGAEDGLACTEDGLGGSDWASDAARRFEIHGAVVMPGLLDEDACTALASAVAVARKEEEGGDFSQETREARYREHRALRVGGTGGAATILGQVLAKLYPLLSRVLQADSAEEEEASGIPLLGSGFMAVGGGAAEQELHKDVHGHDRHAQAECAAGGARAISIQLQLTDTTDDERMGSLELLPGSHRPDAANGTPEKIRRAVEESTVAHGVIRVAVPAGTVTMYSSRLWHCGGANQSERERVFCFLTLTEPDAPAPPGLIHTMALEDVGVWAVGRDGLVKQPKPPAATKRISKL